MIVYATHTLYQFNPELKEAFYAMLDEVGSNRDYYFLSVEGIQRLLEKYQTNNTVIELTEYKNGTKSERLIGETNGHGNWIIWYN